MSVINLKDFKDVLSKIRNNKKKIKRLLAIKKQLERGEYLDLAITAMLEKEHRIHPQDSTLAEMKAIGGIQ